MFKKFREFKESLANDVVFNKKEYLLTLAVCILGGILFGILVSPKRESTIGSFNGNGTYIPNQDEDECED